MSVIGLHLNDAALSIAQEGQLISTVSSVVHADPSNPGTMGQPAQSVARLTPRSVSVDHWALLARMGRAIPRASVAVIRSELRSRLDENSRRASLQCAASAAFNSESLSTLLGIAKADGLTISGFHDAAALAVSALGLKGTTLVLELALGHLSATRVDVDEREVHRRAFAVRRGSGSLALDQSWLQLIAEAMVLKTRFDPLHDGSSEQRVYDLLATASTQAGESGSTVIELPVGQEVLRVTLTRDQFSEAAAAVYDELLAVIHELRPAGARINVLIDESMARLPGLLSRMGALRGCRIYVAPPGLVARVVSLQTPEATADETVPIYRNYAARPPIDIARELDLTSYQGAPDVSPTHVLWNGRAVSLPKPGTLEIGRAPSADGIMLSDGFAGISRLHCSLQVNSAGVTLIPHSEQATWLNDERVQGRVRVQSGDRLRIGAPGVALDLIAVGGVGHGTSA